MAAELLRGRSRLTGDAAATLLLLQSIATLCKSWVQNSGVNIDIDIDIDINVVCR
jgi:cell division inhibitor SulA